MDFKSLILQLDEIENKPLPGDITLQHIQHIEKLAAQQAAADKAKGGWKAFTTFDPDTAGNVALADAAAKLGLPGFFNKSGDFVVATNKRMDGQTGGAPQIAPPTPADWGPLMKMGLVPRNAKGPAGLTNLLTGGKAGQEFDQVKQDSAKVQAQNVSAAFIKNALWKLDQRVQELNDTLKLPEQRSIAKELVESFGYQQTDEGFWSAVGKALPGVGLAAGAYDAYRRAQAGDYTGAALSGAAGLAGLVPGVGTAASLGLAGYQAGRDKARTGSWLPDNDEIKTAAAKDSKSTATAAAPAQTGQATKPPGYDPKVEALQKRLIAAGAKIQADGVMGPQTQAAMKQFPNIKEDLAESMAALKNKLILLERNERDYSEAPVDEAFLDNLFNFGRSGLNVGRQFIGGLTDKMLRGTEKTAAELAAMRARIDAARAARGRRPLTDRQWEQMLAAGTASRFNPATGAARTAHSAGSTIRTNPGKSTAAAAAAGGGLGYALNSPGDGSVSGQSTNPNPVPSTGGGDGQSSGPSAKVDPADLDRADAELGAAMTAMAGNKKPEGGSSTKQLTDKQKELIKEIQGIMAQLADIENQEVFAALQNAQATIDKVQNSVNASGQGAMPSGSRDPNPNATIIPADPKQGSRALPTVDVTSK